MSENAAVVSVIPGHPPVKTVARRSHSARTWSEASEMRMTEAACRNDPHPQARAPAANPRASSCAAVRRSTTSRPAVGWLMWSTTTSLWRGGVEDEQAVGQAERGGVLLWLSR